MRLYREIVMRSFQTHTTYRVEVFTNLISSLFIILIQTSIWRALYQGSTEQASSVGHISIQEMMTYSLLSSCVMLLVNNNLIWKLGNKIGSGEIAMDLIKPIHLAKYMFAEAGGTTLFRIVFELVPLIVFGSILFGFTLPDVMDFLFFVLCLINGIILYYLMTFTVGLLAFWYMVSWHTESIFHIVMTLCSGALFPLWFFPDSFSKIIHFLPFQLIYYGPISIFLGKQTIVQEYTTIAMQLVWIGLFCLVLNGVWAKAVRKLVIQGG
jgi:ABC-2 type transport system permease protein